MKPPLPSKALIIYSLLIPPIMIFLFSFLSNTYGKTVGYFLPYAIYLMILLCGSTIFTKKKCENSSHTSNNKHIYYVLAFVPAIATFLVAFLPTVNYIKFDLLLVLLIYSVLNGFLEELFWRFTFNRRFENDIVGACIIPTVIFSCWHFALLFATGVSYHGGAFALVGGATVMGAIWGIVMFKTKNIKVVISAHVLTNFFAFSQLLYQNWFE